MSTESITPRQTGAMQLVQRSQRHFKLEASIGRRLRPMTGWNEAEMTEMLQERSGRKSTLR